MVRGNLLYVDSTLIQADADADRTGSRALLHQLPDVGEHVEQLWADNAAPPTDAGETAAAAPSLRIVPPDERPLARPASPTGEPDPVLPAIVAPTCVPDRQMSPAASPPPGPASGLHVAGPSDPPNRPTARLYERMVSRTDPNTEIVAQPGQVLADLYY